MSTKKLGVLVVVVAGLALAGCGDDDATAPQTTDQFEAVRQAFDTYLSSGAGPVIQSPDLFNLINDADPDNDPYVLSVRKSDAFAIGHIPGSHNVYWHDVVNSDKLATYPTDKKIAVYCYTGHTGQLAATALSALGYDAVNMKHGIMAWTKDAAVRVQDPFSDPAQDYPSEATVNNLTETYDLPDLNVSSSSDAGTIVLAALQAYVPTATPVIKANVVYDNIVDGNPDNDYFILSVRSSDHYAAGHVPGAYNIPWRQIAKEENLKKLPTDKQIVVYCYTGHTGQIATTVLNTLGYDALNMKFGIMSWTTDTAVRVASPFQEADYPDLDTEP